MNYHGGPLITDGIKVVAIYWSSGTIYNGGPTPGASGDGTADNSLVGFFLSHLGGSPYYNINSGYAFLLVYNSNFTYSPVQNSVTYTQYWASNTNVPVSGSNVSLTAIQNQIISGFTSGVLTPNASTVYAVFSDAGVNLDGLFPQNCGEHGHFVWNGNDIKYAVMPHDIDSDCSALSGSPNNDAAADAEVNVLAHEIEETNTDPDVPDQPAFYDDGTGDEIADLCAWQFDPTYQSSNGSIANMNLGGKDFLIQKNWLAYGGPCAQAGPVRAWISGMNDVVFDWPRSCWWGATSGSAGPLSYAWYRDGSLVGTSNFYTTNYVYQPFNLVLNTTDSRGGSSWDNMYVAIDTDQNDTWNQCNGP